MFENHSGTSVTGKFLQAELCEGQVSIGEGMAGDSGGRSIDNGLCKFEKRRVIETESRLTLLWSIISAITAILPACGPDRRRTTEEPGTEVNRVFTISQMWCETMRTSSDLDKSREV